MYVSHRYKFMRHKIYVHLYCEQKLEVNVVQMNMKMAILWLQLRIYHLYKLINKSNYTCIIWSLKSLN